MQIDSASVNTIMVLQFLKCVVNGTIIRNRDRTKRGFPVLKSTTNVQVGIALGAIGPCKINNEHLWCPDIFTNLSHPNINNFAKQVQGMYVVRLQLKK